MRGRGDAGQLLPLYVLVIAAACVAALVLGRLGALASHRSRASTAADAAALAGAADGPDAARSIAAANGATLDAFSTIGTAVEVQVTVAGTHAKVRAEAHVSPGGALGVSGDGDRQGLAPAMLAALARADAILGHPVPVVSGYRTHAEQQQLYDDRAENPYPVALPGTSSHELGLAADVPLAFVSQLRAIAADTGLCQPLPESDPVHFEPCPTSRG